MKEILALKEQLAQSERIRNELELRVEELTDFIENASLPLHWVDEEGIIKWANQAELDALGYTKEEYVGQSITRFHADAPVIEDILCRLIKNEILHNYPARLKCKDGSIKHVLINSSVLRKEGKFIHTRCFTRDITALVNEDERKAQLLNRLEKSEERLRMAVDVTQLGTWDYDLLKGDLNWSEECRRIFGVAPEVKINFELFRSHTHPDDLPYLEQQINRSLDATGGGRYDITYRILRADNQAIRWVHAQGMVHFNAQQQAERFVGTVVDVTESKLAEEKSAKLAAIVESTDDAIISKTLDGNITSWNKAAERLFGYRENEVLGRSITILIPAVRLDEEQMILSRIKAGKKIENYETCRLRKDGTEVVVALTVSPIKNPDGHIIGASKIARDISKQKLFEDKLQRYADNVDIMNTIGKVTSQHLDVEDILQQVAKSTTVITGAAFGAFFYLKQIANAHATLLFSSSGVSKKVLSDFVSIENDTFFPATFGSEEIVRVEDITKGNPPKDKHLLLALEKAGLTVTSYLIIPVISKSGVVTGGLFYGHPEVGKFTEEHENLMAGIAGQVSIALENATLYEEIQKLNAKKDEFIGLASHELKTPVTSLNGYLQIVHNGLPDGDRNKTFVHKALKQIGKLSQLIGDLLDVSKIQSGQLPLSFTNFDVLDFVKEVTELMQYTTKSHRIVLQADSGHVMVSADRSRLEQVVINLISNAVKYSPRTDQVHLSVTQAEPGKIRIAIKDFGIGIDKKQQELIFSRFYRVEELAAHMSGLGIGLYISREIISRHRGRLWVESEPGNGSTFIFEIPIEQ